VFGFIINLLVDHHTTTTVAFGKSFPHPPPPLERESLVKVVGFNDTKDEFFVNEKMNCEKNILRITA